MATEVVTGIKEIDQQLRQLEPAMQKKFVRSALRNGGKVVAHDAEEIIEREAMEKGALLESVKVRALKRSRNKIGISILPPRDVLFENYEANYGKLPNPGKGEKDAHYYAADIEFGNENQPAIRPFRRALYNNEQRIRDDFKSDVIDSINRQAASNP